MLLLLLVCVLKVRAHLILNISQVWGIENGVDLEQPLYMNTLNPICAGKSPSNNAGIVNFIAGNTYNVPITCGEKDLNAPGCLIGDWHTGNAADDYPGCALAINYNGYSEQSDFKYISYSKDCAKRGSLTSFVITKNVQNCEKCVCSWSLAPSLKYSSPPQFYHNCFYCSITGGILETNVTMRTLDFININGANYTEVTYNDINPVLELPPTVFSTELPTVSTTVLPTTVSTTVLPTTVLPTAFSTELSTLPTVLPTAVSTELLTIFSTTELSLVPTVATVPVINKCKSSRLKLRRCKKKCKFIKK